jgi:hypothetical protein
MYTISIEPAIVFRSLHALLSKYLTIINRRYPEKDNGDIHIFTFGRKIKFSLYEP